MDNELKIPVAFEGKEHEFRIRLVPYGYTYRILIMVEGVDLIFEMDEERNYRVLENVEERGAVKHINQELIRAIINQLQSLHE